MYGHENDLLMAARPVRRFRHARYLGVAAVEVLNPGLEGALVVVVRFVPCMLRFGFT